MQSKHQITAALAILIAVSTGSVLAQEAPGHSDFCDPATKPRPVLSTSDFDGDGMVTRKDVGLLKEQVGKRQYIAFFDRNADYVLDQKDIELAVAETGTPGTVLDRELAAAYHGTKAYRRLKAAIRDGFVPWTESFWGHGAHWVQLPEKASLDYAFKPGAPEGLNYDTDGRLWAVFYYSGPSPTSLDGRKYPPGDTFKPFSQAPEGFCGDSDVWHHHAGVCFKGVNYQHPTMDPNKLSFREGLSPRQCLGSCVVAKGLPVSSTVKWTPKFHMLHAWIYQLNPCGTFADPLAKRSPHPAAGRPHGKIDTLDPHPDYPFAGGTLCSWLGELGQAPEFCARR